MNPIALSAQEMGPAMRQEVLDDHWGAWNWGKIINMGEFLGLCSIIPEALHVLIGPQLLQSYKEAVIMHRKQRTAFNEFSETFTPAIVKEWEIQLEAWHVDHNHKPDPFEEPTSSELHTFHAIQL